MIRIILTFVFTYAMTLSIQAGFDWIKHGYGVHPVIAFPAAALLFVSILGMLAYSIILHNRRVEMEVELLNLKERFCK